jgi:hypothetical protein
VCDAAGTDGEMRVKRVDVLARVGVVVRDRELASLDIVQRRTRVRSICPCLLFKNASVVTLKL